MQMKLDDDLNNSINVVSELCNHKFESDSEPSQSDGLQFNRNNPKKQGQKILKMTGNALATYVSTIISLNAVPLPVF